MTFYNNIEPFLLMRLRWVYYGLTVPYPYLMPVRTGLNWQLYCVCDVVKVEPEVTTLVHANPSNAFIAERLSM